MDIKHLCGWQGIKVIKTNKLWKIVLVQNRVVYFSLHRSFLLTTFALLKGMRLQQHTVIVILINHKRHEEWNPSGIFCLRNHLPAALKDSRFHLSNENHCESIKCVFWILISAKKKNQVDCQWNTFKHLQHHWSLNIS